jgi:large subunit ribosomal protein L25
MAQLKANKRTGKGTHQARRLRKQGLLPAIIYGHGEQPEPISLNGHEMALAIKHGERVLEVDIEGASQHCLIKDLQWDIYGKDVMHVDLYRVSLDERVEVTVPIVLRGTPAGAADGGVLQQIISDLTIECIVTSIPEDIRASVALMKIGDALRLKDLKLPEGAVMKGDGEAIVASVTQIAEEAAAAPAAAAEGAAAEPEVIGRKKEEDEEEGAEKA